MNDLVHDFQVGLVLVGGLPHVVVEVSAVAQFVLAAVVRLAGEGVGAVLWRYHPDLELDRDVFVFKCFKIHESELD